MRSAIKLYQQDLLNSGQSELYGYDSRDWLTSWQRGELNDDKDGIVKTQADQTWNLDPVGNWKDTTTDGTLDDRDHNAVNELVERYDGGLNLSYDDNGNLTDDGEYEYAYDAFNRLKTVTRKSDDAVIAEYTYDTQNRRIKKKTGSASDSVGPPVSVEYAYDGWQVVEEHEVPGGGGGNGKGKGRGKGKGKGNGGGPGGETVRTYTYGNYIDEPITMTSSGAGRSGTFYYHTNNLYNVRALTDEDGDVVERYQYSAYGEPTILDPDGTERGKSVVGNAYMFQGRRHDAETGLYYYRNRYYSAQLGRFVTRDPIPSANLYAAFAGNPMVYVDADGKFPLPYGRMISGSAGHIQSAQKYLDEHVFADSPKKLQCCLKNAAKSLNATRGQAVRQAKARLDAFKRRIEETVDAGVVDALWSVGTSFGGRVAGKGLKGALRKGASMAQQSPHTMKLLRGVTQYAGGIRGGETLVRGYGRAMGAGTQFVADNPDLVAETVYKASQKTPLGVSWVPGGQASWSLGKVAGWSVTSYFGLNELQKGPSRKLYNQVSNKWSHISSNYPFYGLIQANEARREFTYQAGVVNKNRGTGLPGASAKTLYGLFASRWLAVDRYLRRSANCYRKYH